MPFGLFSSSEFWTAVIVALVGGGGVGTIIGALSSRRKDAADIAAQACDILTDKVIAPLREQVAYQEQQLAAQRQRLAHLEEVQRKHLLAVAYMRGIGHWLNNLCEVIDPEFLRRHPKPHLPDELRADIAPNSTATQTTNSSVST